MKLIINGKKYDTGTAELLCRRAEAADFISAGDGNLDLVEVAETLKDELIAHNWRLELGKVDLINLDVVENADGAHRHGNPWRVLVGEHLYRKGGGEYFLAAVCSCCCSIEKGTCDLDAATRKYVAIKPLGDDEARRWAELYVDAEVYEHVFGPVSE